MSRKSTPDPRAVRRTVALVRPHLRKHRGLAAGGVVALLFEVVMRVLEPWPLKFVVDAVSTSLGAAVPGTSPATLQLLVVCGLATVVIVGLRALGNYLATVAFALAGSRIATEVRARLFAHVQRLGLSFHNRSSSGDTVQRIVGDVGKLQDVAVTAGLPLIANVLTLAVMTGVMTWLDPYLALVVVGSVLFYALFSRGSSKKITAAARRTRKGEGQLATTAQESIGAIKVVQAYNLFDTLSRQFSSSNHKALKEGVASKRLAAGLERRTDLLVGIATAIVIVAGGWRVVQGAMTPGDLVLFTTYLKTTMKPLRDLAKYTGRIARAAASGERVADLMDHEPDVTDTPRAADVSWVRGLVEFDHVHAAYGDRQVLDDVSFRVRPGEHVAIVGPSGSGKSTLASLLVRAMDPTFGEVFIDRHPVRDLTLNSLRSHVTLLLQEAVLFSGTIAENIAHGREGASRADVERAARLAHAHDFIVELPDGYDTVVGERGSTLSGGQRQRIAIARALIRDAPVVVLDEATTGLDPEASAQVVAAIDELTANRTTMSITHDLAAAAAADRVIVIDEGRVVADGTPDEVLTSERQLELAGAAA